MEPPLPLVIHEVLPTEVLGAIFEEHAKWEWKAPMTDGRVCRLWRQVVLNTPRVWAYLEVHQDNQPGILGLTSWLRRSGTAPLHISVDKDFTPDEHISKRTFYDLLGDHHKRIAFLKMGKGDPSFFEGRDFPCLRLLSVEHWSPPHFSSTVPWRRMPALRSLRLGATNWSAVPLSMQASFKELIMYKGSTISLPRHFNSLTRLMLDDVLLEDSTSGPMAFPSLTYLSLYDVSGLKPHINAPCLITYHEGGDTVGESFSAPLPSLVEYGVHDHYARDSYLAMWHLCFPNILRLSLRARQSVLLSFLVILSSQPNLLPALKMISVGQLYEMDDQEDLQKAMDRLVQGWGRACSIDTDPRVPIFFGEVREFFIR